MSRQNSFLGRLPPRARQILTLGGAAATVLGVVYLGVSSQEQVHRQSSDNVIKNVLTDKNTREMTIDSMAAEMRRLVKENAGLRREIEVLKDEVDRKDYNAGIKIDPQVLRSQLNALTQEITRQKEQIRRLEGNGSRQQVFGRDYFPADERLQHLPEPADRPAAPPVAEPGETVSPPVHESTDPADSPTATRIEPPQQPVFSVVTSEKKTEVQSRRQTDEKPAGIYLPAGTVISGVLLNGMDAPTGQEARKEPFPAVVRIQKDAILPNRYRSDIRECFLIVSGYGDLSSERAYLRGETISCIDSRKNFIEGSLNSYAVGDDGKAGIRGRLVSKQGQIIAKSMMAGFLSGLADVFNVDAVPTINTSTSGRVSYEHVYSAGALQGAATRGISSSLERIADFYIKMAEGLYPVIEIDAGRAVDLVVSRGSSLRLRNDEEQKGPAAAGRSAAPAVSHNSYGGGK